ncbi:MAG: hypothetical protein R3F24_03790 [Gammaproteobacteria bacterium]
MAKLVDDWGIDGVRCFPNDQLSPDLAQALLPDSFSSLTHLPTNVPDTDHDSFTLTPGASKLTYPGARTSHLIVILNGVGRLYWGDHLQYSGCIEPGTVAHVPPWIHHALSNESSAEALECMLLKTQ